MTLPVRVTPAVTSGIVVGLCQLALEGSERLIEQLNTPALDWIWELPWRVAVCCPVHNTCRPRSVLRRCRFLRIQLMWQMTLRTFRNLSYLVFACSCGPNHPLHAGIALSFSKENPKYSIFYLTVLLYPVHPSSPQASSVLWRATR